MDISDVIRDEDLMVSKSDPHLNGIDRRVFTSCSAHNIQKMVANMVPSVKSKWPSARELNLLKRKAKINSKDQTKSWCEDGGTEASGAQSLTPKGTCPDSLNYSKVVFCFSHQLNDNFWPLGRVPLISWHSYCHWWQQIIFNNYYNYSTFIGCCYCYSCCHPIVIVV